MTTAAYSAWVAAGKPYTLCRPGRDLRDVLRAAGYIVYHYPDTAHQLADPPQDHTPYSATGWPVTSARWIGHAIDIMPKAGLMSLPTLARRIIAAKNGGPAAAQVVKYMNWTDESGICRHEAWQPDHVTTSSSDRGHIHISFRSDMDVTDVVSRTGWNPLTGGTVTTLDTENADWRALIWRVYTLINDLDEVPQSAVEGENNALKDRLVAIQFSLSAIKGRLDASAVDPAAIIKTYIDALSGNPEVIDALATAVASRVGMIPTAQEIARAVGELTWHGQVGA